MISNKRITKALLEFGESIDTEELFPTIIPEAQGFVLRNPFGFSLAICLDRQTMTEIIWTIPFDMNEYLGHLDPNKFIEMSEQDLAVLFSDLPRRPRFVNDAPRTIRELTDIIVKYFEGDASNIWVGKNAFEVKNTFKSIYGVGSAIANMSVLLIERAFKIKFVDIDREKMDIKPDTHTVRVLFRLGVSNEKNRGFRNLCNEIDESKISWTIGCSVVDHWPEMVS